MTKDKRLSVEDVKHVAKLANLPLTETEEGTFLKQLGETITYMDDLQEIDTKGVAPTSQVTGKTNELREDKTTPCLSQEDALKNGKDTHNGFFMSKITWE